MTEPKKPNLDDQGRTCYPFDAKNVPGNYVLRGDGWWCPYPGKVKV